MEFHFSSEIGVLALLISNDIADHGSFERFRLNCIEVALARGEFSPLREWLRQVLHRHGRKFTPKETLQKVTGSDTVDVGPYVGYLTKKYSEIYAL